MAHLVRLSTLLCLVAVSCLAARPAAAAPPMTCTAGLTIFSTSTGAVNMTGQVTHYRDSGVGGFYTSGFLAGYTLSGAQDIMVNNNTNQSELHGFYTAVSPDGSSTLTVRYTGHVDLNTGVSTGHFVASGGTGQLANFAWEGSIAAQLVRVPIFTATDTGPCR